MKLIAGLLLLLTVTTKWQQVHAANILCLVSTPERNYPGWTQPFLEALARRGHTLTLVSTAPDPGLSGIAYFPLKNIYDVVEKNYLDEQKLFKNVWNVKQVLIWYEAVLGSCRHILEHNQLSEVLRDEYDLIIYDATYTLDCLLAKVPYQSNTPVLGMSGGKLTGDLMALMQADDTINPARIPHFTSQVSSPMGYLQRIHNHIIYLLESLIRWGIVLPVLHGMLKEGFVKPNVQLMLLNTHPVLDYAQNMPPNVIEIGGLHIRAESSPLPTKISEFVNRFPDGIVYIHMPHILQIPSVGAIAVKHMTEVFKHLGFLLNTRNMESVQLSESLTNLMTISVDDNVQQDIFALSNLKAFLTHGDSFALQEAVHNAVPSIVMPMLMDQINNAIRVEERLLGIRILQSNFTLDTLSTALNRLLTEQIYADTLQQAQFNFRIRRTKPLDEAVWYAEQLISEPHLFQHLLHPELVEQSYFVSHSLDVLMVPMILIVAFIANIAIIIRQMIKGREEAIAKKKLQKEMDEEEHNLLEKNENKKLA